MYLPPELSFTNTSDMLAGRYQSIETRAAQLDAECAEHPEMTSWLLASNEAFESVGGMAAQERLYHLAIRLAPNCPQPYAKLAKLYVSSFSMKRAADLYQKAAELSAGTIQAGAYAFEEGSIRLRQTGELNLAVDALQQAEQLSGWEGGSWYYGAASFFLGQALQASGRVEEAVSAYQRVLACSECLQHHAAASNAVIALLPQKPKP
jgi:tetratricopeptide (TPR) repeat protein